ncbi:ead/Ea22-like family protein [Klebsiella aerogenes]|uniref:ead/Ea22-like family protein n=1 Tax=Klebsiella aerogenes TaxID=548 RepID=UPI0020CA99D7|nr:ead/Ea22-like family protein [Klebsiella aerogenes]
MTDITELAQSLKAAAEKASVGDWVKESGDGWDAICSSDDQANSGFIIAHFEGPDSASNREFMQLANPANILALIEALEKAQQKIQTHERAELTWMNALELPDAATRNDILPAIHAEKYTLRAANKRIAGLESRAVTVKLPDDEDGQAYGFGKWANGKLPATTGAMTISYCEDAWRTAFEVFSSAAGIKWEAD